MPKNLLLYPDAFPSVSILSNGLTIEAAMLRMKILSRDTALRIMDAVRISGHNDSALQNRKNINLDFHGKMSVRDPNYKEDTTAEQWKDIIDAAIPVGRIEEHFRSTLPSSRWEWAHGQEIARSAINAELVADLVALGAPYSGNGSTTIRLPDRRDRVGVGAGGSYTLGSTGGAKEVSLTAEQNGPHTHGVYDIGHAHGVYDPGHPHPYYANTTDGSDSAREMTDGIYSKSGVAITGENSGGRDYAWNNADGTPMIGATGTNVSIYAAGAGIGIYGSGSGQAHNNMQPYLAANFIIKVR